MTRGFVRAATPASARLSVRGAGGCFIWVLVPLCPSLSGSVSARFRRSVEGGSHPCCGPQLVRPSLSGRPGNVFPYSSIFLRWRGAVEAGVPIAVFFPSAAQRPRSVQHRTEAAWSSSLAAQSTVPTRVGRRWHSARPFYYTRRYGIARSDDFTPESPTVARAGGYRNRGEPPTH